jgi:hypothetical protein
MEKKNHSNHNPSWHIKLTPQIGPHLGPQQRPATGSLQLVGSTRERTMSLTAPPSATHAFV